MKLKKILSGFLAAAMAVTTMVTATFNAGAATLDKPDGTESVIGTFTLSDGETIKDEHVLSAQYDSGWASLYNLPDDTFTNENYYVKVTYTTETALTIDGNTMGTIAGWGWDNYSKWPLNVGKFYDTTYGTIKAEQHLMPASTSTDTAIYCYLPVSDFKEDDHIAGNVQNLLTVPLTVKSVQLVEISAIPAPDLPANEYVFDKASGTTTTATEASELNYGNPVNTVVGADKTITHEVLEGDFVVVVPYESDSRPKLTLSDGSGGALNWIQLTPYVVADGVAYYTKADVVAAWKAAGGSKELTEVVQLVISATGKPLTVTGAKLYSSVAVAAEHTITIASGIENGTVAADKEKAAKNEKVTLTVEPATGYELDEIIVSTSTEGTDTIEVAADNTFTMPDANVTVTATFKKKEYTITDNTTDTNGTVTIKNAAGTAVTKAAEGDEITITATGKTGYELDTLKVNDTAVTPAADGTYTHTMTAANTTVEATFKEKVVPLESLSLKATETVLVGGKKTLTATKVPEDTTDKIAITWSSSDATIASVNATTGEVTGVAAGKATITATCGTVTATCEVTVTAEAKPCTSITLDKTEAEVAKGKTVKLTATPTPEDTTDDITWTTSDSAVATVEAGTVTAVAAGTATITVTCGDQTAACKITVPSDACTSVTLDQKEATILKGKTVTLKATALPEGTPDTITWTSDNEAVATVKDGVVTGVSRGIATITVKCGEQTAACKVSVNEEETIAIPADPTKPANQFRSTAVEGKYNENDVFVLSADDVAKAKSVTVTVTDGTKTYKQDVTACYKKVTYTAANGTTDTITAGANYLLAVTVTGIPEGTSVTVSIAVNK